MDGLLILGLLTGLVGSIHCMVMCGPIAMALPMNRTNKNRVAVQSILYSTGRLTTYISLGYIFSFIGYGLKWMAFQQMTSVIIGILILLSLLRYTGFLRTLANRLNPLGLGFVGKGIRYFLNQRSSGGYYMAGLINGLIPCGVLYMALGLSLVQNSVTKGMLVMLGFGLGTFPIFLILHIFGMKSQHLFKNKTWLVKTFTVLLACLFIYRGLTIEIPLLDDLLIGTAMGKITNCE